MRVVVGQRAVKVPDEFPHLLREALRIREHPAADRARGATVAAGRAPDAEVDAPGIQRFKHAEGLCDLERAVVRQQHAPGANTHARGFRAEPREQDLGAGVGERADRMVLGEPVARVPKRLGGGCKLEGFLDRFARRVAADDRGLVEYGEFHGCDPAGLVPAKAQGRSTEIMMVQKNAKMLTA